MTDLRKAAEMALDALDNIDQSNNYDAIQALRQALAQPPCQTGSQCIGGKCPECEREWVGLTDEEGAEIWGDAHDIDWNRLVIPKEIVKRIEAKLKEKNT